MSNKDALIRLIEYAQSEARQQRQAFVAYLLDLARLDLDTKESPPFVDRAEHEVRQSKTLQ